MAVYQQSWTIKGPQDYVDVVGKDGHIYRVPSGHGADVQQEADNPKNPTGVPIKDLGVAPAGKTRTNPDGSTWTWNGQSWDQTSPPTRPAVSEPAPAPAPNLPPGSTRPNSDGSSWVWDGKSWALKGADPNSPFASPAAPAAPTTPAPGWSAGTWAGPPPAPAAPAVPGEPAPTTWVGQPNYNLSPQSVAGLKGGAAPMPAPGAFPSPTYTPAPPDPSTMPINFGGAQPTFDGVNQQASDVTAGLRAQLAGLAPRAAPQAGAPPPAQTTLADAGTLQRAGDISAAQAGGTQLQRVGNITAASAAPTSLARVDPITGATIDQGASNETRAQQETSLAGLRAAATGAVPSAAELQLRQTTDRNIKNQYALAAALQGRSAGGALKQASDATGDLDAQAAADAAVLRAKEQSDARNAESAALSGVRGQDIGVATSQAGLTQGAQVQNQNTGVQQNTTAANLQQNNQQFNAGLKQAADITNQGVGVTQNATQFNADTDLSKFNAGLRQGADIQNQNTAAGENKTQYQGNLDVSTTNANNATGVSKFNSSQAQALAIQNTENQLKQTQLDDTQKQVVMNAMLVAQGQQIQGVTNAGAYQNTVAGLRISQQLANQAKTAAELQFANGLIGTFMGAIAAYAAAMQSGGANAPVTIPGVSPGTTSSGGTPASTLYPQGGGVGGTDRGGGQTTDQNTDEQGNPIGETPTGQGGDQ